MGFHWLIFLYDTSCWFARTKKLLSVMSEVNNKGLLGVHKEEGGGGVVCNDFISAFAI